MMDINKILNDPEIQKASEAFERLPGNLQVILMHIAVSRAFRLIRHSLACIQPLPPVVKDIAVVKPYYRRFSKTRF